MYLDLADVTKKSKDCYNGQDTLTFKYQRRDSYYNYQQKTSTRFCKYKKPYKHFYAKSNFEVISSDKYNRGNKHIPSVESGFVIGYMAYTDPSIISTTTTTTTTTTEKPDNNNYNSNHDWEKDDGMEPDVLVTVVIIVALVVFFICLLFTSSCCCKKKRNNTETNETPVTVPMYPTAPVEDEGTTGFVADQFGFNDERNAMLSNTSDAPPSYETVQYQNEDLLPSYNDVMTAGTAFVW